MAVSMAISNPSLTMAHYPNGAGADSTSSDLKAEFFRQLERIGRQEALLPTKSRPIDDVVRRLEQSNPTPCPLAVENLPMLLGEWELIYASRGTVVTRQLTLIPDFSGGVTIKRVWQTLTAATHQHLHTVNGAVLALPIVGEWQLQANGRWTWAQRDRDAKVAFGEFSIQATRFLGQPHWCLPALTIPVLAFLRNEALWTTSYLDATLRIGRGATGNVFVFQRA